MDEKLENANKMLTNKIDKSKDDICKQLDDNNKILYKENIESLDKKIDDNFNSLKDKIDYENCNKLYDQKNLENNVII